MVNRKGLKGPRLYNRVSIYCLGAQLFDHFLPKKEFNVLSRDTGMNGVFAVFSR